MNELQERSTLTSVRLSQIVSALSHALDLTEGQPVGHSIRTCHIGMEIARMIGLPRELHSSLYYALLLKDIGCSSVAARVCELFATDEIKAKFRLKTADWTRPGETLGFIYGITMPGAPLTQRAARVIGIAARAQRYSTEVVDIRCHRGAAIVQKMGFPPLVGDAILHLDEHWNGAGKPQGVRGENIPLLARILCLAQTLEVFMAAQGAEVTLRMMKKRRGRWFDPALCDAAAEIIVRPGLQEQLRSADVREAVMRIEPQPVRLETDDARLDDITEAFAAVIDAKSPYTSSHSVGVTGAAVGIASSLGLPEEDAVTIRRAALLHDIGKLGVPNTILDKPGKLTEDEWTVMRRHPDHTRSILGLSGAFSQLADLAAAHHEKLDGSGYPRGLRAEDLSLNARILAVADIYDALSADRPYRAALPWAEVQRIIRQDTGTRLCADAFAGLCAWHGD
ncbi:MAG: HD domain-containing protein [Chloroflexi bacterium]|nr:HD domain-containing protein [Chloroflexota bacterium]